jgi:hypothetical protein
VPSPSRHDPLCPSPHSEPGVQVSRTGLPRSPFTTRVRQSHGGSPRTATRTRRGSGGSTSTAGGAGCVCAVPESNAAGLHGELRQVAAGSGAARSTGRSHAASSSADVAGLVASSADVPGAILTGFGPVAARIKRRMTSGLPKSRRWAGETAYGRFRSHPDRLFQVPTQA